MELVFLFYFYFLNSGWGGGEAEVGGFKDFLGLKRDQGNFGN